jgi:phage terminase small subunit
MSGEFCREPALAPNFQQLIPRFPTPRAEHAMTAKKPTPPEHLKPSTRDWFASVSRDYDLEPHHYRLLTLAGESWDRAVQARERLETDGIVFADDRGNIRAHPCIAIERDSRIAFARLIRELDLDVESPTSTRTGPPGIRSNGR